VANIRLRFIKSYRDRHGKVRHYLRKPGCKPIALPGLVGSDEFMRAYGEALAGLPSSNRVSRCCNRDSKTRSVHQPVVFALLALSRAKNRR